MAQPKIPAPIDRPLSRAYLRKFQGWATASAPGLSDPASLRIMENTMIDRDGSVNVRPGLRYLSYVTRPTNTTAGVGLGLKQVGTHEAFYLADGSKAYLFCVRENDNTVGFRVMTFTGGVAIKTLAEAGFAVTNAATLNFPASTTYVKFLQIDNKIFALSNAGAPMRLFTVGLNKTVATLISVNQPNWDLADKLKAVQPDYTWITGGVPTSTRTNLVVNPSFQPTMANWTLGARTEATVIASGLAQSGSSVAQVTSLPSRTNLCPQPLHAVATTGITGWSLLEGYLGTLSASTSYLQLSTATGSGFARSPYMAITGGKTYTAAMDIVTSYDLMFSIGWYDANYTFLSEADTYPGVGFSGRATLTATAPANAAYAIIWFGGSTGTFKGKNVVFCLSSESSSAFSGSSGTDYYWTGTVNASTSVYHPVGDVTLTSAPIRITSGGSLAASVYARAVTATRTTNLTINYTTSAGAATGTATTGTASADSTSAWTRYTATNAAVASTAVYASLVIKIVGVARGEYHYVDAAMLETGTTTVGTYFDGFNASSGNTVYSWSGSSSDASTASVSTYTASTTVPTQVTKTAATLIALDKTKNIYNFGFFYTFNNQIGESAASQITQVKTQRGFANWKWETPNPSGEPSGTDTEDPLLVADQLVAYMPQAVFNRALEEGAVSWNLYMFTWSDQDPVPTSAMKVATVPLSSSSLYGQSGWARITPATVNTGTSLAALPTQATRYNYSKPSSAGQGLVAADRMVLVYDPDPASTGVIRWTSNLQGEYSDFSAVKGGGYKTLTSGNLYVPAAVKLWQNPQSVDTLTVLCLGTDGHSAGYYMAPANVTSQSENTIVMGFEETTATPGTTSPYGCEVFNNALYHPLDDQLMKSTANNYNITHKSLTEDIRNNWTRLINKHKIVSSLHDGRLYYLVHNPEGLPLEDGCLGNEIWVYDAGSENGSWSRWLIQAHSLRKIEFAGQLYMSVMRPDGTYYLDPAYAFDDVVNATTKEVSSRAIPWRIETNTQGANRAHDAWAHLQQVTVVLGSFSGTLRYGIRSWDIHGQPVEISKLVSDTHAQVAENAAEFRLSYDLEDMLQIRRDLKEWFFFAESALYADGSVVPSTGQINYVQYRYTPSTVNTGYEYGSVETFEYGRSAVTGNTDPYTTNGVPVPAIDGRRP